MSELKKRYEEPLEKISGESQASDKKQRILLEFKRDDEVESIMDDEFEKSKNRVR